MQSLLPPDNRVIKLFTITTGISTSLLSLITQIGYPHYEWVDRPELADYLTFPTNYEVGHEFTDFYIHYFNGIPEDRALALQYEEQLMATSYRLNKKLIIFYFSDLVDAIPIDNAVIFRTSLLISHHRTNEFAMPAFKPGTPFQTVDYPEYVEWKAKPRVGFRGQSAPLKLKTKIHIRNRVNLLCNRVGRESIFRINTNYGYLQRRNAMMYLQKNKSIQCDFSITTEEDISKDESIRLFWKNLLENPFTLCVSGYGNYSYRMYEALSVGRIPVFVDTDCKLPFEEFINWKEYVVWADQNKIPTINRLLLAFHQEKQGDAFLEHQKKQKDLWTTYLSPATFFIKLKAYL